MGTRKVGAVWWVEGSVMVENVGTYNRVCETAHSFMHGCATGRTGSVFLPRCAASCPPGRLAVAEVGLSPRG